MQRISTRVVEKLNKTDKSLTKLTKRKTKVKINKIIDEDGDITNHINEIRRISWKYFKNLHFNKLENLEKMG
jgi:hypothetical protein